MSLSTQQNTASHFAFNAPLFAPAMCARHTVPCMPALDIVMGHGAANDSIYFSVKVDEKVRILSRDATDRTRMVLSGRMADVCAALERMSRAENITCVH